MESASLPPSRVDQANAPSQNESRIDTIRDLLFGEQSVYFEDKIQRLESELRTELKDHQRGVQKRMGALEQVVKDEFIALRDEMRSESGARETAASKMETTLDAVRRDLSSESKALEDRFGVLLAESRSEIGRKIGGINGSLTKQKKEWDVRHEELETALSERLASMEQAAMSREDLGTLFRAAAGMAVDEGS